MNSVVVLRELKICSGQYFLFAAASAYLVTFLATQSLLGHFKNGNMKCIRLVLDSLSRVQMVLSKPELTAGPKCLL